MAIRIYTNKKLANLCEIELWWNHNHNVDFFHLTSFCPILSATRDKLVSFFEQGMTASEAFHHHETQLMRDPVTAMFLADRKICPSLPDVNNVYEKLKEKVHQTDLRCLIIWKKQVRHTTPPMHTWEASASLRGIGRMVVMSST